MLLGMRLFVFLFLFFLEEAASVDIIVFSLCIALVALSFSGLEGGSNGSLNGPKDQPSRIWLVRLVAVAG